MSTLRVAGALAMMALIVAAISEPRVVSPMDALPRECAETLVAFSPCLPYLSSFPNNLTSSPPAGCCEPAHDAFQADEACLCHLVVNRSLLGFPLNITRLVSLFSLCRQSHGPTAGDDSDDESSLLSRLCFFRSGALPPFHSSTGSPSSFADQNEGTAPEPAKVPLTPSATRSHVCQILPGVLIVVMNFCFFSAP